MVWHIKVIYPAERFVGRMVNKSRRSRSIYYFALSKFDCDKVSTYFRTEHNNTRLLLRVENLFEPTLHYQLIEKGDSAGRSAAEEDAQARNN
ncbi:MAG: hypothetical protein ACD_77C00472G0007 [uncultured bacterium]|nr:MAG: hypothetical protein ACD_77C00472G0007 [uncultured bacterium]